MDISTARLFLFNTRDARRITDHHFDFSLASQLNSTTLMTGFSVYLKSLNFTNLTYPINIYNNEFVFQEQASGTIFTGTITPGSYSIYELITEIELILAAGAATYTVTYDDITELVTISATAAFRLVDSTNSIFANIGMEAVDAYATSIVSSSPINVSGAENLQVLTDLELPNYSSNRKSYLLETVPIDSGFGAYVNYQAQFPHPYYVAGRYPDSIGFQFIDDLDRPFNFPDNVNVKIALLVIPHYDHPAIRLTYQ